MKNSEENKQLTFWDWSPEDCPADKFDLSKHMNPPEELTENGQKDSVDRPTDRPTAPHTCSL